MYTSNIKNVSFYILNSKEIADNSNVIVKSKETFKNGLPTIEGVYDPHMGTTDHTWKCLTCMNTKELCPGHAGSIELNYPLQSPLFKTEILKWLRSVCFNCGMPIYGYISMNVPKSRLLQEYASISKSTKTVKCVSCNSDHPQISRDKNNNNQIVCEYTNSIDSKVIILYNHIIENILAKINENTINYFNKKMVSHPSNMMLRTIVVPPNTIRPDLKRAGKTGKSNHNELTILVKGIVEFNEKLDVSINDTNIKQNIANIDILNMFYHELIKGSPANSTTNHITNTNKVPLNSISSRIPKKEGRVRSNMMGRRVGNMTRSVITGDANLEIDQVIIPKNIATEIQIPETVQYYNIDKLNIYFNNKRKYPGCTKVLKKSTGYEYWINDNISPDFKLEIGDVIMRDIVDGDILPINRQPSLSFTSISAHRVVVVDKGDSIRINVSACNFYNADFDGDQMYGLPPLNLMSRIESKYLIWCGRWFVSYSDSNPMVGCFQDPLIGTSELTQSYVRFNKLHAMRIFGKCNIFPNINEFLNQKTDSINQLTDSINQLTDSINQLTGRDIISILLRDTPISLKKKSKFYNESFENMIDYNKDDIMVEINRGVLKTGVLDKATVGQGQHGTIFHIVHNLYGPKIAFELLYKFQKVTENYFYNRGFTVSISDMIIPEEATNNIYKVVDNIMNESLKVTTKLDNNLLIPPIGMSLESYYEKIQLEEVLNAGDDFNQHIYSNIDVNANNLYKLVNSGSKGNDSNLKAIVGTIGQLSIAGQRMTQQFNYKRTMPYFFRFSADPRSRGYVTDNFINGVGVIGFIHGAQDGRYSMINNALNTSVTGDQNRTSIKNLESIITDNLRKAVKANNIIQYIYGEDGVDPSKLEKIKFPTILLNTIDFKKYDNNISDEFKILTDDREYFRETFMKIETQYRKGQIINDVILMPVNIARIIDDVMFSFNDSTLELNQTNSTPKNQTPMLESMWEKVLEFCDNLPYLLINNIQEKNKIKLSNYIVKSFKLFHVLIRSYLNTKNFIEKSINFKLLNLIIDKIKLQFIKSLMDAGTAVGIIAAQSAGQPLTQMILDSKHRAGTTGSSLSGIIRIKEIFGAKDTSQMKNPTMQLFLNDKFKHDKDKAQLIANYIEMMPLKRFVNILQIFYEEYGNIVHPLYKHEVSIIKSFEKHNPDLMIPTDITKWCIRIEIDKVELITKNMELETILISLSKLDYLYIINTAENADIIVIRIYVRNNYKKLIELNDIIKLSEYLLTYNIRGIDNLTYTTVDTISRSIVTEDGSVKADKQFIIRVNGTNLSKILENKDLDIYKCDTDSIVEIANIYGIEAARQKLISELKENIGGLSHRHYTIFADEMTFTGNITSIQKTGLSKRESENVLLRVSDKFPIQVLEDAAINNMTDNIKGLSAPLMVGRTPNIGTLYNELVLNESFIEKNNNIENIIDSL
jgi:DNA-directed RNA polymerase beta' subunit